MSRASDTGPTPRDAPAASDVPTSPHDTGVLEAVRSDDADLEDLDFDPEAEPVHDFHSPAPLIVVFDVGEVLIDETRVWAVWAELLGVSPLSFAAVLGAAIVQGEDHRSVFGHIAPNIDWQEFEDEHERRYGGFRREDLYADAEPCLTELKTAGVTVAIAGNQPARRDEQLAQLGLHYDVLATSARLGHEKPSRGFFDAVMVLTGATDPSEVLYVGDRIDNDILPAGAYGMRTCWLRRGPWGQLQDLPMDDDADLVLEGLGELPLLLQEWRADPG